MKNKNLLVVMIFFVVLFNSIVYSALNSEMFINGDAHIRVDKDIRITNVKVLEQVNGSYETYNSDYSKNTTSMQVTLPSSESFMVYEITITNKGDTDYEVTNILEESYSNNNIKYELIDINKGTIIYGKTTHTFKIKFTTTENNPDNKTTLVLKYDFKEWIPSLYKMVAHKSRDLDTDIDFGVAPTKDSSGVYEMNNTKDDEYPVYYYRGIIDNNNVDFAGFCWKIVRTTSTGGVKLIYNGVLGSDGSCNNTGDDSQIGKGQFNSSASSKNDVSYVYDDGNDSSIKKVIDKWYSDNMTNYTGMLEDTIWCNDRSISSTGNSDVYFGICNRIITSSNPIVTCPNKEDSFTVSKDNGNKKLLYPVGLLTADEITLAGTVYNKDITSEYLDTNKVEWTMTPVYFGPYGAGIVIIGANNGDSNVQRVYQNNGIRPSISLVSGTMIKEGNGSVSNPYKLVEDKIQTEWTFDYTGEEQEFIVPYDGIYKLEVWGAQGGNSTKSENYRGGYGAYAIGTMQLQNNQKLYINVGGQGKQGTGKGIEVEGGYNGGGSSNTTTMSQVASDASVGGGGGSTHISTKTGLLSTLSESLTDVLIVAGAGGGGSWHNSDNSGSGGDAGGIVGSNSSNPGPHTVQYNRYGIGGTQSNGGCSAYNPYKGDFCGLFGKGDSSLLVSLSYTNFEGSGGGSGYYGGSVGYATGGGGGSSYIGNPLLSNKVMYCYNCQESNDESTKTISTTNVSENPVSNYAKKGNGYVRITLVTN